MNQDDIIKAIETEVQRFQKVAEETLEIAAKSEKQDQWLLGRVSALSDASCMLEAALQNIPNPSNYPKSDIINTIQDDLTALYYTAKKLIRENEDKDSRSEFSLGKAIGIHYAAKLIETSLDDLLNPTQESSTEGK